MCPRLERGRGRWQWRRGVGRGLVFFLQFLEAAVHVSFAALAGPGAALHPELPQVLLEVLVVHGTVRLGLALHLERGGKKYIYM